MHLPDLEQPVHVAQVENLACAEGLPAHRALLDAPPAVLAHVVGAHAHVAVVEGARALVARELVEADRAARVLEADGVVAGGLLAPGLLLAHPVQDDVEALRVPDDVLGRVPPVTNVQ